MQGWNETGTLLLTYETKKTSSTATLWIRPYICYRIVQGIDYADHQLGLLFNNKYMCINNKKKILKKLVENETVVTNLMAVCILAT